MVKKKEPFDYGPKVTAVLATVIDLLHGIKNRQASVDHEITHVLNVVNTIDQRTKEMRSEQMAPRNWFGVPPATQFGPPSDAEVAGMASRFNVQPPYPKENAAKTGRWVSPTQIEFGPPGLQPGQAPPCAKCMQHRDANIHINRGWHGHHQYQVESDHTVESPPWPQSIQSHSNHIRMLHKWLAALEARLPKLNEYGIPDPNTTPDALSKRISTLAGEVRAQDNAQHEQLKALEEKVSGVSSEYLHKRVLQLESRNAANRAQDERITKLEQSLSLFINLSSKVDKLERDLQFAAVTKPKR